MENPFAQQWTGKEFIKFVLPSVMSLITISLYMMVDAVFVSRYAGPMALAAVNIVMPLFNLGIGLAIMTAAGSSAIIGIELGGNRQDAANRHFSLVFCFLLVLMVVFYISIRMAGTERIARLLGASDILAPLCTAYLKVFLPGITAVLLQLFFEYFIRLDGRPGFAFLVTLASGLTNVMLDYWLIAHMGMGIRGAGIASSAGILVAVAMGIGYFAFRSVNLIPCRPVMDIAFIWRSLVNGSSEMVTDLSAGIKILVFTLGFVAVLPGVMGLNGIWICVPLAEACAMVMSAAFFMKLKGEYLALDKCALIQ